MSRFLRSLLVLAAICPMLGLVEGNPVQAQEDQGCFMVNSAGRRVSLPELCPQNVQVPSAATLPPAPPVSQPGQGSATAGLPMNSQQTAPGAPASQSAGAYPTETVQAFMNGCLSEAGTYGLSAAQANSYCSCVIQEFQNRYSFEAFQPLAMSVSQGQFPPEFMEVVNVCLPRLMGG